MGLRRRLAFALIVFALGAMPARASTITLDFDFVASGIGGLLPPVDPVIGSFSATFDNAADILAQTTGISFTSNLPPLGSALALTYDQSVDELYIGGVQTTVPGMTPDTDDFRLHLGSVSTNPTFLDFGYAAAGRPGLTFFATQGSITPVAVPEPLTVLPFGVGIAAARVRRRRQPDA